MLAAARPPAVTDLLSLARSVWELLINVEYLCLVPGRSPQERDLLALRYLAHYPATGLRIAAGLRDAPAEMAIDPAIDELLRLRCERERAIILRWLAEHHRSSGHPDDAEHEAKATLAEWGTGSPYWAGKSPKQMADAIGGHRPTEYSIWYPLLSGVAHGASVGTLPALLHTRERPLPALAYQAVLGVRLVTHWLLDIYDAVSTVYGFGWRPDLENLFEAVKLGWRRAVTPSDGAGG